MSRISNTYFLYKLAHLYGVQTAYYDVNKHRQQASRESLLALLHSLGAPVTSLEDTPSAWRELQQVIWQRPLEPVIAAWNNRLPAIPIRLPSDVAAAVLSAHLKLDTGEERRREIPVTDIPILETGDIEGIRYVVRQLQLPGRLPLGYHKLAIEIAGTHAETTIISAPVKAFMPPAVPRDQHWGLFLPLYALHTEGSLGAGNFTDLEALTSWVAEMGGQTVATLPLLASFLDDIFEPSPYLPVSRLLWNEFYLDINVVPELQKCRPAQAMLESSLFQSEIESIHNSPLVDYKRQMVSKRKVLEELCRCLFTGPSERLEELRRFAGANPAVEDYARFRAAGEKYHLPWRSWPHPLYEGILKEGDYNEEDRRYHLYAQWLAHQQIGNISRKARKKGVRLYLDLPLGVHPDGYDTWREREVFIRDTSTGAPPDAVFTRGQNWESPPLHPGKIREQGYRYLIACLRHHLQFAGMLRVDHVMGLHRLFCIPNGMEASDGVYLRYRSEELYAILSLESHRHRAIIVGEDLGMVPPYVRPAMKRHNLNRMYVLHYELLSNRQKGLPPVPRNSVASLNTHDMHPFAAFWKGLDINERKKLGLLDRNGAQTEKVTRRNTIKALAAFLQRKGWLEDTGTDGLSILKACLSFLAGSRARLVLVNLEDLWLETRPQNIPSTGEEFPNWQRKAKYGLEEFCQMPQVLDTLRSVNLLRKQDRQGR